MEEQNCKIILSRSNEWLNRLRGFKVMLDGAEAARIKNGDSIELMVEPGLHTLKCRIDWCSSKEFIVNAQPGNTAYVKVKSGMKYFWPVYILLIIGLMINFVLEPENSTQKMQYNIAKAVFMLIPAIYLLYYTVFARDRFLWLGDDKDSVFAKK
jgi:hypothetical protein